MNLTINSHLIIPSKELQWRFSRASGPGGQGVNTTDSRVELVFNLKNSSAIGPFRKQRLLENLDTQLINGYIRIVAAEERSQHQNRQLALDKLAALIRQGLRQPPKTRKMTKPSNASQKKRLKSKKQRGAVKKRRQEKPSYDE